MHVYIYIYIYIILHTHTHTHTKNIIECINKSSAFTTCSRLGMSSKNNNMQIFPSCIANLFWKTYKLGSRFFWTHPQILTCRSHTTPRAPDMQTMHRRPVITWPVRLETPASHACWWEYPAVLSWWTALWRTAKISHLICIIIPLSTYPTYNTHLKLHHQ